MRNSSESFQFMVLLFNFKLVNDYTNQPITVLIITVIKVVYKAQNNFLKTGFIIFYLSG